MEWLSFFGSIIGGLIGGLFTYFGVVLTIKQQEKNRKLEEEEKIKKKRKSIFQSVLDWKWIILKN